MGRSLIQRALVVLLFAALLAPVLEAFDRWDSTPGLAGDTEFHVAALAVATGLIAAVTFVAVRVFSPLVVFMRTPTRKVHAPRRTLLPHSVLSGSSPPGTPLRI
jgi:hypothetical protein